MSMGHTPAEAPAPPPRALRGFFNHIMSHREESEGPTAEGQAPLTAAEATVKAYRHIGLTDGAGEQPPAVLPQPDSGWKAHVTVVVAGPPDEGAGQSGRHSAPWRRTTEGQEPPAAAAADPTPAAPANDAPAAAADAAAGAAAAGDARRWPGTIAGRAKREPQVRGGGRRASQATAGRNRPAGGTSRDAPSQARLPAAAKIDNARARAATAVGRIEDTRPVQKLLARHPELGKHPLRDFTAELFVDLTAAAGQMQPQGAEIAVQLANRYARDIRGTVGRTVDALGAATDPATIESHVSGAVQEIAARARALTAAFAAKTRMTLGHRRPPPLIAALAATVPPSRQAPAGTTAHAGARPADATHAGTNAAAPRAAAAPEGQQTPAAEPAPADAGPAETTPAGTDAAAPQPAAVPEGQQTPASTAAPADAKPAGATPAGTDPAAPQPAAAAEGQQTPAAAPAPADAKPADATPAGTDAAAPQLAAAPKGQQTPASTAAPADAKPAGATPAGTDPAAPQPAAAAEGQQTPAAAPAPADAKPADAAPAGTDATEARPAAGTEAPAKAGGPRPGSISTSPEGEGADEQAEIDAHIAEKEASQGIVGREQDESPSGAGTEDGEDGDDADVPAAEDRSWPEDVEAKAAQDDDASGAEAVPGDAGDATPETRPDEDDAPTPRRELVSPDAELKRLGEALDAAVGRVDQAAMEFDEATIAAVVAAKEIADDLTAIAGDRQQLSDWAKAWREFGSDLRVFRADLARARTAAGGRARWLAVALVAACAASIPAGIVAGSWMQDRWQVIFPDQTQGWKEWLWQTHSRAVFNCRADAAASGSEVACVITVQPE